MKSKSKMNLNNNYLLTHTLISFIYRSLSYYVDSYECSTAVQFWTHLAHILTLNGIPQTMCLMSETLYRTMLPDD